MTKNIVLLIAFLFWLGVLYFFSGAILALESGMAGVVKFGFYNLVLIATGMLLNEVFRQNKRW